MDLQKFFMFLFVRQGGVTRIKVLSMDTKANVFVKATLIVKFRMYKYDIPCTLEKIIMTDLSTLITWSSKIT